MSVTHETMREGLSFCRGNMRRNTIQSAFLLPSLNSHNYRCSGYDAKDVIDESCQVTQTAGFRGRAHSRSTYRFSLRALRQVQCVFGVRSCF